MTGDHLHLQKRDADAARHDMFLTHMAGIEMHDTVFLKFIVSSALMDALMSSLESEWGCVVVDNDRNGERSISNLPFLLDPMSRKNSKNVRMTVRELDDDIRFSEREEIHMQWEIDHQA